jgi:starvation-inducible DNA-binding protein
MPERDPEEMTAMHPTRNDLPEATRAKVVELLNARLADAIDLSLQAKQAHWNVKGPQFIALHELFDKVHDSAREHVDLIAERAVTIGGSVDGTVKNVAARTTLPPCKTNLTAGIDHVRALADALAATAKGMRTAIDAATDLRDAATADLFTEVVRDLDQQLWFVEAHVQAER